jgi:flagellar basal-body rod modification protein FlgD
MATSPIGSTPSVANTAAANLKLDDLLRVLLAELSNQDPLKPVDNKDFMAQIAQFASLDTTQQLNQSINQLLVLQSVNQSVGLIGRTVTAITDTGPVTGRVIALSLSGSAPTMTVQPANNGSVVTNITLGQIQTVLP